jgi:flagellar biogenesis protein FliO
LEKTTELVMIAPERPLGQLQPQVQQELALILVEKDMLVLALQSEAVHCLSRLKVPVMLPLLLSVETL